MLDFPDPLPRRPYDPVKQLDEGHADELGQHGQIGVRGVESGERVDLDELRLARCVGADIDPTGVPAAERAPRLQ